MSGVPVGVSQAGCPIAFKGFFVYAVRKAFQVRVIVLDVFLDNGSVHIVTPWRIVYFLLSPPVSQPVSLSDLRGLPEVRLLSEGRKTDAVCKKGALVVSRPFLGKGENEETNAIFNVLGAKVAWTGFDVVNGRNGKKDKVVSRLQAVQGMLS